MGITPYHFGAVAIAKETVDGVADGTAMLDADIFNYGMATMIDDNFQSAQSVAAVTCYFATTEILDLKWPGSSSRLQPPGKT